MFGTGIDIAIEPIMVFGIGFFVAAILAVAAVAMTHARAVRITTHRLDAAIPISMREIQAEKDVLRAEFAMTARRLETSIDELKAKTAAHVAELGKKTTVINRLKHTLDERSSAIMTLEEREKALETREKTMFEELHAAKAEILDKTDALREMERTLVATQVEFADLQITAEERAQTIERQRVEILTLRTHIDSVRRQVADFANDFRQTQDQLSHHWVELKAVDAPIVVNGNGRLPATNGFGKR